MRGYSTEGSLPGRGAPPQARFAIDAGIRHLQTRIRASLCCPLAQPIDVARVVTLGNITQAIAHLALIVVGGRASDGRPILSALARIRAHCPYVGIFLVTDGDPAVYRRLASYIKTGVDEVAEIGDPQQLARFARIVRARLEAPAPEAALWRVRELTQSTLPEYCIRNAYRRRRTADIASRFGVDRTTLRRRCTSACGASPNELMRLGLLLHFAELRRTTGLTRQQIGIRLGFESPSAISMLKARLLHRLPVQWQSLLGE